MPLPIRHAALVASAGKAPFMWWVRVVSSRLSPNLRVWTFPPSFCFLYALSSINPSVRHVRMMLNGALECIPIASCSLCTPCETRHALLALDSFSYSSNNEYRGASLVRSTKPMYLSSAWYALTGSSLCIGPCRLHCDASISCFVQLLPDKGQSIRCSSSCRCFSRQWHRCFGKMSQKLSCSTPHLILLTS